MSNRGEASSHTAASSLRKARAGIRSCYTRLATFYEHNQPSDYGGAGRPRVGHYPIDSIEAKPAQKLVKEAYLAAQQA